VAVFAFGFIGTVNEFRGRVDGNYVRIDDERLSHTAKNLKDGQDVVAFARPHDTEIVPVMASEEGVTASINRIVGNGANVRVELFANGQARKGRKDYFEVELPGAKVSLLGLATGQSVKLKSRRLSVFPEQNVSPASRG
jgi:sulfate/thiosulfate transport system ATP-binding protein